MTPRAQGLRLARRGAAFAFEVRRVQVDVRTASPA